MGIDSRASAALHELCDLLLARDVGDQLPSRQGLARQAGVGIGTLTRALDTLIGAGAVALHSVQGAGTSVQAIDYAALWQLSGRSILRGQLPMNLSVQMEAIEVAIGQALTACSLDSALVYREGASRRMRAVEDGLADFAVVSSRSLSRRASLGAACGFGAGSYYGDNRLYLLRRSDDAPIRTVGVDEQSPDHVDMVTGLFPDAEIVPAPFRLIPPMIIDGRLDATIWFGGTALPVDHVNQLRTEAVELEASDLMASEALVAVIRDGAVAHLFKQLDATLLRATYAAVLDAGPSVPTATDRVHQR